MVTTVVPSVEFKTEFQPGLVKSAISEFEVKARDLLMVPIDAIRIVSDFNVRIRDDNYEDHVEEIKASIIANGFYSHQPLKGYVGKEGDLSLFYLVGGFTRFEAAKRAVAAGAPLTTLPMVVVPPSTSMIDLMFGVDQDNTSNRLRPYERAILVKRAIAFGAEEDDVAAKMGISVQYVKDLQYAMSLPKGVQQMIIDGQTNLGNAVATGKKHGKDALKVLKAAIEASVAIPPAGSKRTPPPPGSRGKATRSGVAAVTKVYNPNRNQLRGAIIYSLDMLTEKDTVNWLKRWFHGEKDALKELRAAMKDNGLDIAPKPIAVAIPDPPKGKAGNKGAKAAAPAAGKGKGKGTGKGKGKTGTATETAAQGALPLAAAPSTGEPAGDTGGDDDPL